MLRLWLPHRHLLSQLFHPNEPSFPRPSASAATSPIFVLRHLYTPSLCLDRRRSEKITAVSYESSSSTFEKKSKGQRKREALRSVDWAAEFAKFSDSQLRKAIRWGDLKEELFEAVRIVKKIGRDGRHARTRQLKLIGGMLRGANPEMMEAIIKAIKDGDVEGVFNKSGEPKDEDVRSDAATNDDNNDDDYDYDDDDDDDDGGGDDDDDDDDDYDDKENSDDLDMDEYEESSSSDEKEHDNVIVERWLQGLLSGDSDVTAEVYSIRSADFNRQELRRLVRDTLKSENRALESGAKDDTQSDPRANLREYLEFLNRKKSKN